MMHYIHRMAHRIRFFNTVQGNRRSSGSMLYCKSAKMSPRSSEHSVSADLRKTTGKNEMLSYMALFKGGTGLSRM